MWAWRNSKGVYVCLDCQTKVQWNTKTGDGWCKCKLFIPEAGRSCPPYVLKGEFKSRQGGSK